MGRPPSSRLMHDLLSGVSSVICSSRSVVASACRVAATLGSDTAGSCCLVGIIPDMLGVDIKLDMTAAASVNSNAASAIDGASGGPETDVGDVAAGTANTLTASASLSGEAVRACLAAAATFSCDAGASAAELPALLALPRKESKEGVLAADAGLLVFWIKTKWVDPASGASEQGSD